MVSLQAPVKSVVGGATAKELTDKLGIATVEDLLRHYPRRYYERGELTDLSALRPGEIATVQATIALGVRPAAEAQAAQARRRHHRRPNEAHRHLLQPALARQGPARRGGGVLRGQGGGLPQPPDPDQPRGGGGRRRRGLRRFGSCRSTPRPPSCPPGGSSRPSGWRSTSRSPTRPPCPTRCRPSVRLRRGLLAPGRRPAAGPPARHPRRRTPVAAPAAVRRGVRAAGGPGPAPRRRHGRAGHRHGCRAPTGCSRRSTHACRSRSPSGQEEVSAAIVGGPRPRAPDAPAAAGRGRLGQDRRGAAGHARRGRRRWPGRAARTHRGPGAAAPPVDHRDARAARRARAAGRLRPRHPGRPAHRVAEHRRPAHATCSRSSAATPASSSARTR